MSQTAPTTVRVDYKFREGYHIFTSRDVDGVFVASKNAEKAVQDLSVIIANMLRLNFGIRCNVEPAREFGEFIAHELSDHDGPPPSTPRTFVVRKAA